MCTFPKLQDKKTKISLTDPTHVINKSSIIIVFLVYTHIRDMKDPNDQICYKAGDNYLQLPNSTFPPL